MLTQEQIQQAVSDAMPDVLAGLKKEIQESAVMQAKNAVHAAVTTAVSDWITKEFVPEIKETLMREKDGLLAVVPEIGAGIAEQLQASLLDSLKKKLENTWERKKIFEAIIG